MQIVSVKPFHDPNTGVQVPIGTEFESPYADSLMSDSTRATCFAVTDWGDATPDAFVAAPDPAADPDSGPSTPAPSQSSGSSSQPSPLASPSPSGS